MKHFAWLAEFHRQWFDARGKKLGNWTRPFKRDWTELLDAAGITKAEDIATAVREAEKLQGEEKIILKRMRYRRYMLEGLSLPLSSEAWFRELFSTQSPVELRDESLAHVDAALARTHSLHPKLWSQWLSTVRDAFKSGRSVPPLSWRRPGIVRMLLELTFGLTSRTWPEDTYVREASVELGLSSKQLERSQRAVEACLKAMFGRPMPLESLRIFGSQPRGEISGELLLHFPEGPSQQIDELKGIYVLTDDLKRAVRASTPAKRILTVENSKTTFRRLASLNASRETLIIACAYPGRGLSRLLELLPADLPVYHFGDTDPAGFLILSKLRRAVPRHVTPFLMDRRESGTPVPLSGYDRGILPGLLMDPELEDVRDHLELIASSGDKADFEQESLGRPDLPRWPFYRDHPEASSSNPAG